MKILIIGEYCTDRFVYGECNRICPEAPVPVFNPVGSKDNAGMAKNVFNNFLSINKGKYEVDFITNQNHILKSRIVDIKTNQMLVRIDDNDKCPPFDSLDQLLNEDYDAIVISDYNKGFLTEKSIEVLINEFPLSFVDSKKVFGKWLNKASFVKINQSEYEKNKENLIDYKGQLIVTLGEKGVLWDNIVHPPSRQAEVSDLSGAGDTFLAAFVHSYLESKNIESSIQFAQDCSLKVVEKKGVVVFKDDLDT